VIQSAKLLSSINVVQFYPSQFVLVTDILDTFGRLVYHRLLSKSNDQHQQLTTRETALNWFHKIASIRELLPRFYGLFVCWLQT
jgi:hypothetical protein